MWHKWHFTYTKWHLFPTYQRRDFGIQCDECAVQVTHGQRAAEGRAETAAAHAADHGTVCVDYLRAFTYGRALLWQQAYTFTAHAGLLLGEDGVGTGKATGTRTVGTPGLRDSPQQAGLDRGGVGVHVVAVEAQAGFQAQRIAGTQADGLYFGLGQQAARQAFGIGGRYGDFEAVFTGVA